MMQFFFVNYDKSSDASTISWVDDEIKIQEVEPYIDFIRCDLDGSEFAYLHSDEGDFDVPSIDNFAAISGDEDDTFLLCYTADIDIDLDKHPEFKETLNFSNSQVEVVMGFKKDGEILDDCSEEFENRQVELELVEL